MILKKQFGTQNYEERKNWNIRVAYEWLCGKLQRSNLDLTRQHLMHKFQLNVSKKSTRILGKLLFILLMANNPQSKWI